MFVNSFSLPSFAKINLSLRVLGRRPADGYHEIRTVFQTVSLHDRLTFDKFSGGQLELTCNVPHIPVDETNLVRRAWHALRERYAVEDAGARIHLVKRIPAGGGLGGGSSNAAVALTGLARLWKVAASMDELTMLGARLGADVPFFFTGGTALGLGLGTEIEPLADVPTTELMIVTPGVHVATVAAYKALNAPALTKQGSLAKLLVSCTRPDFSGSLPEGLHNDFEPAIFRLHPEIERARDALLVAGAQGALLSGSGASVFGFFDSQERREQATEALRGEAAWQVFACTTLARAAYRDALAAGVAPPL